MVRQSPRAYSRTPDQRLYTHERARQTRQVQRSTQRGRGVGFGRRTFRLVAMGDYVLAIGPMPSDVREALSVTHVEQHMVDTGVAWFPKEAVDDAA